MIFGLTFVLSAFVLQSLDFSKIMKKDSRSTAQGTALLVLLTFLFAAILGFFFIFILNLP
ncbi:MAG: hypothetical protein DRP42_01405 [Tenericutes bacterium]|nr:MAG: hypothetical protein DRP42_01405 [Mycoplasmatota bacterium]